MSTSKNKVQLCGNLGADPDVKIFDNGTRMVRISLATHEVIRNKAGELVEQTYWHNLVCWGKVAEMAEQNLHKGMEVAIEGKLESRAYTDKEGHKRYVTEVNVSHLLITEPKNV